jgi:hypothetical protein
MTAYSDSTPARHSPSGYMATPEKRDGTWSASLPTGLPGPDKQRSGHGTRQDQRHRTRV